MIVWALTAIDVMMAMKREKEISIDSGPNSAVCIYSVCMYSLYLSSRLSSVSKRFYLSPSQCLGVEAKLITGSMCSLSMAETN